METVGLALHRQFEEGLAKAVKNQLEKERSMQNQMLCNVQGYDRWAKAHQLDIEEMPGRTDIVLNTS